MKANARDRTRPCPSPALARLAFCQLHRLVLLLCRYAFDLGRRSGSLDRFLFDFFLLLLGDRRRLLAIGGAVLAGFGGGASTGFF